MGYRVTVTFDGTPVLDATGELGDWLGYGEGLPGNVAVALNATGQEHPRKALLAQALDSLDDSPEKDALVRNLEALLPRPGEPPVLCFSYDDPGPRRADGTPVRTNIELVIEPGQAVPVMVSADNPNVPNAVPHEYIVAVQEV